MDTVRWNIDVSSDTDQSLRKFLALHNNERKTALSEFIEEAVRAHILELSAEQAKKEISKVSEKELEAVVDEALEWARKR